MTLADKGEQSKRVGSGAPHDRKKDRAHCASAFASRSKPSAWQISRLAALELSNQGSIGATSVRIVPLIRWPLAAEKLPAHQNEDYAASAAEFSF